MERREFLLAAGATPLLSACSATSRRGSRRQPVALGSVGIRNYDDRPHQVTVTIFDGEDRVFRKATEVEAASDDSMGSEVVARDRFVDAKSAYEVRATVDTDEETALDLTKFDGVDCYVAVVRIETGGNPTLGVIPDGYECESRN